MVPRSATQVLPLSAGKTFLYSEEKRPRSVEGGEMNQPIVHRDIRDQMYDGVHLVDTNGLIQY